MNVGESGPSQRFLLLLFGHVERSICRGIVEWSVVANHDESGNGEDLVDLLVQSWCVSLVPHFVNGLHGEDTVEPGLDAARPVLGLEACSQEGSCRKFRETLLAQRQHGLGEVQECVAIKVRASLQHAMSKKTRSRTKLKNSSARRQHRDAAGNVVSDLRAPGTHPVSRVGPGYHFCSAVPVVAVGHIPFL